MSSISAAAAFSSRYSVRLVPGIGTTSSPWWSSHASASWTALHPTSSATSRTCSPELEVVLAILLLEARQVGAEVALGARSRALPESSPRPSGL